MANEADDSPGDAPQTAPRPDVLPMTPEPHGQVGGSARPGPVTWLHSRLSVHSPRASPDRALYRPRGFLPRVPSARLQRAPFSSSSQPARALQGRGSPSRPVPGTHRLHPFYPAGHLLRGSFSLGPTSNLTPTPAAWVSGSFLAQAPRQGPGGHNSRRGRLHTRRGSKSLAAPPRP